MLAKKKLQLMKDMWHNLFFARGDQVEEIKTIFLKYNEYYLVYETQFLYFK
jgi:hypothetical protein